MKHVLRFAAIAVVVVAAALISRHRGWWGKPGAKRLPAAAVTDPGGGRSPTATTAPPAQPAPDRAIVARDDDPRGDLRLEGIVLDAAEHGVGGARVAIDSVPARTVATDTLPMKCMPVTVAAAPIKATIIVPAAWTVPKP